MEDGNQYFQNFFIVTVFIIYLKIHWCDNSKLTACMQSKLSICTHCLKGVDGQVCEGNNDYILRTHA